MKILFYSPSGDVELWMQGLTAALPDAQIRVWSEGDQRPADYAIVWGPPLAMLEARNDLKAIFNLGAGVDAILKHGSSLPDVPIVRLEDAGMGMQMAEYVTHAVLRYFRRFDQMDAAARKGEWAKIEPYCKSEFEIGILGLGVMGKHIANALAYFGFPLRGWSRERKSVPGMQCFAGAAEFDDFLSGARVLVCALPLTPDTVNVIDRVAMGKLPQGAYLINIGRGAHVAEPDLLNFIKAGHIAGATLDTFRHEPLPIQHPFWEESRISITPHIAALTLREESIAQIAEKIKAMEHGQPVTGVVDRILGY